MTKIGALILTLILFGCADEKKKERPRTPRIVKQTKVLNPKQNQRIKLGENIAFEMTSKEGAIDSVLLESNGEKQLFTSQQFEMVGTPQKVGSHQFKYTIYFGGNSETHYSKVIFLPNEPPIEYTYELINTYPHDSEDYTQGLLIEDGYLYESTGQNGQSTLEKKEINTGKTIDQINLSDDFFGEGLAILNDKFYQLTFTSGACFVYDKNFNKINTFNFQGQGWGIAEFEGNLLMTNGSEKVFVRDPNNFSVIAQLEVYDETRKVDAINELEIIDGMIYANVYQENYIVAIDPNSGAVIKKIDMSGLLSESESRGVDVLNGIAYDQKNDRIFVTGKLWPKLFEVKFIPKPPL